MGKKKQQQKKLSFTTPGSKKVLSPPSASKHHVAQQSVLWGEHVTNLYAQNQWKLHNIFSNDAEPTLNAKYSLDRCLVLCIE